MFSRSCSKKMMFWRGKVLEAQSTFHQIAAEAAKARQACHMRNEDPYTDAVVQTVDLKLHFATLEYQKILKTFSEIVMQETTPAPQSLRMTTTT